MDVLSAVGLAGNVVQFVEFGCQLFSASQQIRRSADGLSNGAHTLQIITADLQQLCTALTESMSEESIATQDRHVASLGAQCLQIAEELLDAVAKLKPKKGNSRWSCFQAALKTIWKQDEIDRMTLQLNGLRMELMLRGQFASHPETLLAKKMKEVAEEARETRLRLTDNLDHLDDRLSQISLHLETVLEKTGPTEINKARIDEVSPEKLSVYAEQLVAASLRQDYLLDLIRLFKSLHFEGSGYRHSKISEAHPKTFEWAYQHRFAQTLQSNEPFFWISGKPGSGKSTFMKFVVANPRTAAYLRQWAGSRTLIAASYFFWINGSTMQRSQEGLLRSILLDILLQCPDLRDTALKFVKELDRSRWDIFRESMLSTIWDLSTLFRLLRLLTTESQPTHCLCLFIDGLDEYDGEPQGLIDLLISLQGFQNVKLCVASRPWNQFESAFGTSQQHKIYMQDLSYGDIRVFVRDKLEHNPEFRRMKQVSADVESLVSEITDGAQGVFLWVRLVVQSLLRGLQNADRIIDLRRRLAEYPRDLDDFFRYILDSIDPFYRAHVAQGFKAAQVAPRALSILQFWYLDHEDEDPDYATKPMLSSLPTDPALLDLRLVDGRRALDMNKRLAGRFKGFLEVTHETAGRTYLSEEGIRIYEMKVDFLHRTVKDFLATNTCREILRMWIPTSFNVHQSLYKAYLADLKDACARPECIINIRSLQAMVGDLCYVRADSLESTGDGLDQLFQELRRVSTRPTPSYYGTSLEQLLGKHLFLESSNRLVDHLMLVRGDRVVDECRVSHDVSSDFEDFTDMIPLDWARSTLAIPSVLEHADLDPHLSWYYGAAHELDRWSHDRPRVSNPMSQPVDERSLTRHLNQGHNITADKIRHALNSGLLSPTFVRNLLDCVAKARERKLCESA